MAGIVSTYVTGMIDYHYFNKKVDKTSAAIQKILDQVHKKSLSFLGAGSNALTSQQLQMINNATILLHNFRTAYSEEMEKTVEKISQAAQERLAQIDTLVYQWTQGIIKDPEIQEYLHKTEGMIKSYLSLKGGRAVLTRVSPACIPPFIKNASISIRCDGYFPDAGNRLLKPTLTLKGRVFEVKDNIKFLEFAIPYSLLFSSENQPFQAVDFEIKIPYLSKSWFNSSIYHWEYKGYLCLLPDSPGKITLQYTLLKEIQYSETRRSGDSCQDSRKHGGEGCDIRDRPYALHAEPGWSIVPGSSQFHITKHDGKPKDIAKNSWRLQSDGPQSVIYHVSTVYHTRLFFHISATVVKTTQIFEERSEELNLKWGESVEIHSSKYKNWKIVFNGFDGSKKEYNGNVNDTFISIQSPNGIPLLTVKPPRALPRDIVQSTPLIAKL